MKDSKPILFKDPTGLTRGVRGALYIYGFFSMVGVVCGILNINTIQAVKANRFPTQDVLDAAVNDYSLRGNTVNTALSLTLLVSMILFLKWVYRANRNVCALGAENLSYSPAFAVGSFFIWKAYKGMVQLWQASANPTQWHTQKSSLLLPCWWTLWIITALSAWAAIFCASASNMNWDEALNSEYANLITNTLDLPLTALQILIVNRIHNMQMTHAAQSEHWVHG